MLFGHVAGVFIARRAIEFVVPLRLGRSATPALGLSPFATVLLRASPEFPLYVATGDSPITAEA
ncbi:MAG: hypothetical protein EAZ37_06600 [Burkholderiales bacterium]|nr:MAG: hypothetical protein EAZ37_06600 [Burkholderiales bacterium]